MGQTLGYKCGCNINQFYVNGFDRGEIVQEITILAIWKMGSPVNGPSTSLGEALETWNHLGWCDHCTALWDIGNGSIVLPRTIHAYFPLQQITPLPFLLQETLFSHLHLLRPPHLPPDSLVVKLALARKLTKGIGMITWNPEVGLETHDRTIIPVQE
jgi:hypothetical protein